MKSFYYFIKYKVDMFTETGKCSINGHLQGYRMAPCAVAK